jgi:hypothetical protein
VDVSIVRRWVVRLGSGDNDRDKPRSALPCAVAISPSAQIGGPRNLVGFNAVDTMLAALEHRMAGLTDAHGGT